MIYQTSLNNSNLILLAKTFNPAISLVPLVLSALLLALSICWFLPNTYQLFKPYDVAILEQRIVREPAFGVIWHSNIRWASMTAILLAISFLGLTEVSEFIYFQF